jgi:hypothetical protein
MAISAPRAFAHTIPESGWAVPRTGRLRSLFQHLTSWANACADYYAAAALYEELRGLSDAELSRRGLARSTLARDVCQACERGMPR